MSWIGDKMTQIGAVFGMSGTPGPGADFWYSDAGMGTNSGVSVTHQTALQSSVVYACVKIISGTIGALPLKTYRRGPQGDKTELPEHPVFEILHDQANDEMTAQEFREAMTAHALMRGTAYAEILPGSRGGISQLVPIHPDVIRPKVQMDDSGRKRMVWLVRVPGEPERALFRNELFIYRALVVNPDGVSGLDPIMAEANAIGARIATQEYGARFFQNDAQAGLILRHPAQFKDKADRDRFIEGWDRASLGSNRHRTRVVEFGIEPHSISMTNDQSQFLETQKYQDVDIARIFAVQPHKVGILDRATFCLPAGTDVLTEGGPEPIEDVQPGTLVWSLDASDKWVKSKVIASQCSGEDEILTIRTTNRELRCNAHHPILCRRKYPEPTEGTGGYQSVKWVNEFVPAGELAVGDTVITLDGVSEEGSRSSPTRMVSEGFMEFCGLLLGDGNVYPNWGVSIARAENAQYMDHYRGVIRSEFRRYDGGNGRGGQAVVALAPVTLQEQFNQTKFASVLAARELKKLGFGGNARTKRVPSWVFKLEESLRLALVRGFLDADGSVDKKGRASFSSCNPTMLSQIRHLCMMSGIPVTNQRCQNGETTLPSGKPCKFEQWNFTCSDPGENRRIGSNDPRYVERMGNGRPFERKARAYPRFGGDGFDMPGCSLARIVAITVGPAEPVYDLQVADTENFVADGVVVHNTNIEQQAIEFVTDTLMPWAVRWHQCVKRDLIKQKSVFVEHSFSSLLRGDTEARFRAYAVGRNWGWLSANDVRRLENMNRIQDGDDYLRPLNMVPAGDPAEPSNMAIPRPTDAHVTPTNGATNGKAREYSS